MVTPTLPVEMLLDILPEINSSNGNTIDFWDILKNETTKEPLIPELITINYDQDDYIDETFTLSDDEIEVLPVTDKSVRKEQEQVNTVEMLTTEEKEAKIMSKRKPKPIMNQVVIKNGSPFLKKGKYPNNQKEMTVSMPGSNKLLKNKSNQRVHTTSKQTYTFECNKCGRKFAKDHFLKTHVLLCIKKTSSPISNENEQRFEDTKSVKLGLNPTSKQTYSFECKICTKKFMREVSLQAHLKRCKYKYSQVVNNIKGQIANSSDCSKCGKKFSMDIFLKTHQVRCLTKTSLPINNENKQQIYDTKGIKLHDQVKTKENRKPKKMVRKTKRNAMWVKPCVNCNGCRLFCGKCKNCRLMPLFGGTNKNRYACEQRPEKCENTEKYSKKILQKKLKILPEECKACGKQFIKSDSDEKAKKAFRVRTKNHINTCGIEATIPCDFCENKYRSQHLLNSHIRRYHERPYKCDKCSSKFPSNFELQKHHRYKHEGIAFTCEICGTGLAYKNGFKNHMLNIHGGNTFLCSQCPLVSNTEHNLQRHIDAMHSGVTFDCKSCISKLHSKKSLEMHENEVHGNISYGCDECEFQTRRKGSVRLHKRHVHEGMKGSLFACEVCGEKRTKTKYLLKHKLEVHGITNESINL